MILSYLLSIWLLCILSILLVYRRDLLAVWQEPVLRYPILIVESDDWGAGPISQAEALGRLSGILSRHQDMAGRHPVMTIAVVLAVPDGPAIRSSGDYHRKKLGDPCFLPVLEALKAGVAGRVFALQLHGLEHYWPATLMASTDSSVRQWLNQDQPQRTELLPAHLQSRWIDATVLPSRPLLPQGIEQAAAAESALFAELFGQVAIVAVPTTFVWDDNVEAAWAGHGVEFVITPGRRNNCRDGRGEPGCASGVIRNGDSGKGVTYLVRNSYFEPEKGHTAKQALDALHYKTKQGRPCLLETHRSNFLAQEADRSYMELDHLMSEALRSFPGIRFMSTLELGKAIRDRSHNVLESNKARRLVTWVARLEEFSRFRKLAWITGLMLVIHLSAIVAAQLSRRHFMTIKPPI